MITAAALSTTPMLLATGSLYGSLAAQQRDLVDQWVVRAVNHERPDIVEREGYSGGETSHSGVPGVEVSPNFFHFASFDVPLGTGNLSACSALALMYPKHRLHYLAHVMPLSRGEHLLETVRPRFGRVSPRNLDIFVLPGAAAGDSSVAGESLQNIFSLLIYLGWQDHTKLVMPSSGRPFAGLIVYEGELYSRTIEFSRKPPTQHMLNKSHLIRGLREAWEG